MIELRHVTKRYGAVEALHDVSFRAPEGQIVGLLGQNGAGKSTTLNILTGYLPPTSGQVLVDGMDLLQNARECKRLIGYLPEKPLPIRSSSLTLLSIAIRCTIDLHHFIYRFFRY